MKKTYLERIKITTFGAFYNKTVGPFTPQLNIVFGKNEAGKTTVASFVGGVLFGWRKAHGSMNTYKPENAERSGSLFFATPRGERELSRTRNRDGLLGERSILGDLDKDTFDTMFSLTSDELLSLKNTTDVAALLLTAGSGTKTSPAHALAQINRELARYTSRAGEASESLVNLRSEQEHLRLKIEYASCEVDRFKRQDKEMHALEIQREELQYQMQCLNEEIESLKSYRDKAIALIADSDNLEEKISTLYEEECAFKQTNGLSEAFLDDTYLTDDEEASLRERLDELHFDQVRKESAVELAQAAYHTSKVTYESLLETDDSEEEFLDYKKWRTRKIFMLYGAALLSVAVGLFFLLYAPDHMNDTRMELGVGFFVFAGISFIAAFFLLGKPGQRLSHMSTPIDDAKTMMVQDEKKLELHRQEKEAFRLQVCQELSAAGLGAASGSLQRARVLLDELKERQLKRTAYNQQLDTFVERRAHLEGLLVEKSEQIEALFKDAYISDNNSLEAFELLISCKETERAQLQKNSESVHVRYGELSQELSVVATQKDFDAYKLANEQLNTRIEDSTQNYVKLLLAKRALQDSITTWEKVSQPEVYRQASRLFSMMTEGRWVNVVMEADQRLTVSDSAKNTCSPEQLSLGTRQQLYLSLRIALLLTADNVGAAIPILADDILVNFDSTRREGAARAIVELANKRQVILFTCHEEIVKTMRKADPTLNEVVL